MKSTSRDLIYTTDCPTPHGVGGLKSHQTVPAGTGKQSHAARGGWIEIRIVMAWINGFPSPTPHGVGGLKSKKHTKRPVKKRSHPARGGWIEI